MKSVVLVLFLVSFVVFTVCETEFTVTPFGRMPKECVHAAGDFDIVEHDEENNRLIIHRFNEEDNTFIPEIHEACLGGKFDVQRRGRNDQHRGRTATAPQPNGWAAYSLWLTQTAMDSFGGYWTVPGKPQQDGLQTLFLFTGFQNSYAEDIGVSIIQPVLQWGSSEAGGGEYWAIASWFVGTGNAVYSKLATVNAGDVLIGNMTLDAANNKWDIVAVDQNSGVSSSISVLTGVSEIDAFCTLEVYGVSSCEDYPNGVDKFYNLYLTASGKQVIPQWQKQTEPGCEEAVTIVNPTEVDIQF